jgi:hypothetical protein
MAAVLATLQDAKDHLRVTWPDGDPQEPELQAKLDAAEAIVLDYIEAPAATPWVGDLTVRAAILLTLGELWRFRGDDLETQQQPREADGYLNPVITTLLHRKRKRALA